MEPFALLREDVLADIGRQSETLRPEGRVGGPRERLVWRSAWGDIIGMAAEGIDGGSAGGAESWLVMSTGAEIVAICVAGCMTKYQALLVGRFHGGCHLQSI